MYNRYVPQADGSFLKTRLQEPIEDSGPDVRLPEPPVMSPSGDAGSHPRYPGKIGDFFRNLLPHGLDTEDLIVILLLLLLGQDGGKNGNRALLTLGAYLFL